MLVAQEPYWYRKMLIKGQAELSNVYHDSNSNLGLFWIVYWRSRFMECIEGKLYLLYLVLEVLIKRHIFLLKMIKVNIFYRFFPFKYLEINVELYKMSCSRCFLLFLCYSSELWTWEWRSRCAVTFAAPELASKMGTMLLVECIQV